MSQDTESTINVETGIANYDFLKFVDGNFIDLVSHYVNIWQAYHQVFTKVAMDLVMFGGILWVAVLALKAPADKLKTAAGALVIVLLTGMLLQPGNYKVGPNGSQVGLAAGAGYTLLIVGNIYTLFKSALDSVNKEGANALAFNNAYSVTNQGTVERYKDSTLFPMMNDYVTKCQGAVEQYMGSTEQTRKAGWAVGLFGSSSIGQSEADFTSSKEMVEALKDKNKDITNYMQNNVIMFDESMTETNSVNKIRAEIADGVKLLNNIPDLLNPFFTGDVPTGGYKLPSKAYWITAIGKEPGTGPEFESAVDGPFGNAYMNSCCSGGNQGVLGVDDADRFYPKNCAQMFLLVSKGVENFNAAAAATGNGGQKTATMRDGVSAQNLMMRQIKAHIAQQKLIKSGAQNIKPYANQLLKGQEQPDLFTEVADSTMTFMQDIGMGFREWMLKFKIPTMINGCAMLAGMIIVMFPIICVFAVFLSPNTLITFVKLLVLAFTLPFINDMCLTMASSLLAMNGELLNGFNAGNYTENWALLISAASAQYVIFIALTAVEIIIAKMLIWDDVKGLAGFNPAGAATGMAATGMAISGAALKVGSLAFGGGKLLAKGGAALASGAAGNAGKNAIAGNPSVSIAQQAYGKISTNYTNSNATPSSRGSINLNPQTPGAHTPPATGGSGPIHGGGHNNSGGGAKPGGGSNQPAGNTGQNAPSSGVSTTPGNGTRPQTNSPTNSGGGKNTRPTTPKPPTKDS
jgi:hypothetical protein